MSIVSKAVLPVFVPTGQVFAHRTVVFAYDDDFHFGVLTSGFHHRWALRYSSSLETRPNYAHTDAFETFPQPPYSKHIESVGRDLHNFRSRLMVNRKLGLTGTYNLVHSPEVRSDQAIKKIRDLHVELDFAMRDAYGWFELDLQHGFHRVQRQGIRFTFSPLMADEILERLLELNKERYEKEVAKGLHDPKKKKRTAQRAPRNQSSLLRESQ